MYTQYPINLRSRAICIKCVCYTTEWRQDDKELIPIRIDIVIVMSYRFIDENLFKNNQKPYRIFLDLMIYSNDRPISSISSR